MKTEKVEGALVKLNILKLAMTALAEQEPSMANDLYNVLSLVEEVKDELNEAIRGDCHESISESHCL